MITRKTRRGIIALVLLTGVSYWAAREQGDDIPEQVADFDPKLNYVLRDFELQVYGIEGNVVMNLKAPILRNNPSLQLGTIENPLLVLHREDITWQLEADSATITADKEHVELLGNVYVQRLEQITGSRLELNTSEVSIEVEPQTALSDKPVSLFDGLNQVDAVGMELDMMNDTFKLMQQVKAVYAAN